MNRDDNLFYLEYPNTVKEVVFVEEWSDDTAYVTYKGKEIHDD